MNLLISLFDLTGNASRPYRENGWKVAQVDKQLGMDIFDFNPELIPIELIEKVGIIAMAPCTDYALSGAKHFKAKDKDGRTAMSQKLVERTRYIIDFFKSTGKLNFWQIEQPMTRLHKLNPWIGEVKLKFNPCDFAQYDIDPDNSRYNKQTWLFGEFNELTKQRMEPIHKESPIWSNYGGKSLKTKNARSITPLGFAYAFYHANH